MADEVVQVTEEGYGQRLVQSLGAAVVGIGLFFGSFLVLWWNEGNVVAEKGALSEMQSKAVAGNAKAPKPGHNGKLIHAVAELKGSPLGDELLVAGDYLVLERTVEMFQWIEKKKSESQGNNKTKTTYSYEKGWDSGRNDSSKFAEPRGHSNPEPAVKDKRATTRKASFGAFDGLPLLEQLSPTVAVPLTPKMLKAKTIDGLKATIEGGYVMLRRGGPGAPAIGDLRLRYRALKPGTFSAVGLQASKTKLAAYAAANGKSKLIVQAGRQPLARMIELEKQAASGVAMVLRVVGFFMMWFGLSLVTGPLSALVSFLPFLGSASRMVLGVAAFGVAAVLSTVTIVLGMIAHHPVVLVVVLAACAGGFFLLRAQRKRQQAQAPAPAPAPPEEQQQPGQVTSAATALSQHMAGIRQVG
jgi:hypothetical protein